MRTMLNLTKNRYSSQYVVENAKDLSLTEEYAAQIKKGQDAQIKREKEIEARKKKEQWAVPKFDAKKGLGGYSTFEKKPDAERYIREQIEDAKEMISAIKRMTGDAIKEEKALEKYLREAKPVAKESIY